MRDKRPVDELSIEELERILAIRKREARQDQLRRMKDSGRVVVTVDEILEEIATTPRSDPAPAPKPAKRSAPPKPAALGVPNFEDEHYPTRPSPTAARNAPTSAANRVVNNLLLLVEVAAVFGLIFIAVNLFTAIDALETETAEAQLMSNATRQASVPTLQPTAQLRININDYVLPGGHVIDDNNIPARNLAELSQIPANLRPIVQQQLFTPIIERPPQTAETALAINIPSLGVDQVVIQGADWEALRLGVGQVINGYAPSDETGNVAFAAHNDIYGELFRELDTLEAGDEIFVQTATQIHRYRVTHWEIVSPTDVQVLDSRGRPTITLISCYPYRVNTQRIVVYGERVDA